MLALSSLLRRAAAAVALAMALSGCAGREAVPSAMILSGGGAVSDRGTSEPPEPDSSPSDDDTPSFQELPSSDGSSQSSQPSQSSQSSQSSEAPAPPPSSSEAPSSSQAPPPSSSQPAAEEEPPEEEAPDEQDEEEEGPDWEQDDPDWDDPDEDEPDYRDNDRGSSGWEDLKVKNGGSTVSDSAVSIVSRIVQNEVGSSFHDEAIKAQAVAAYTFVRYHNSIAGDIPSVGMSSPSGVSDKVARLVREVAGEQISYNGSPILATYCAMSAGTTASSRSVWGSSLPYLVPVESKGDRSANNYRYTVTMSAGDVQKKLENALGIWLNGTDPKKWFNILSYWDDGPYVNKVSIAGKKETTGRVIRESILGLRSAAFEVEYNEKSDKFTFTTYGYGHGVGMSQMGANHYAGQGWDYVDILEHYYTGATVG